MAGNYIWCDIVCVDGKYIYEEGVIDTFKDSDNVKYKFGFYNIEPYIRHIEEKYHIEEKDFKLMIFNDYGNKNKTQYRDCILGVYRKVGGIKTWYLIDSDLID